MMERRSRKKERHAGMRERKEQEKGKKERRSERELARRLARMRMILAKMINDTVKKVLGKWSKQKTRMRKSKTR